jgi:hypothetical protein
VLLGHSAREQMGAARALKVAQTDSTPAPQGNLQSGALLEIGVVRSDDSTPVIVHAMKARPKFLR